MNALPEHRQLSVEVLTDLCLRARAGDLHARNNIIEANMRLVGRIAARQAHAAGRPELLGDLVQEGVCGSNGRGGLVRAIELYDARRGRWSTHAGVWILKAVKHALKSRWHIAASARVFERHAQLHRTASTLRVELGREPTAEEVRGRSRYRGASVATIESVLAHGLQEVEATTTMLDGLGIHDERAETEDQICERLDGERQSSKLRKALAALEPDELAAVSRRYGIGRRDGEPTMHGCTPSESERRALAKLRDVFGKERIIMAASQSGTRRKEAKVRVVDTKPRPLPCPLTQNELGAAIERTSTLLKEKAALEDELRSFAEMQRAKLRARCADLDLCYRQITERIDYRPIACEERHVYDAGLVRIVRLDTGAIVEERPMTAQERQLPLDAVGA